MEQIDVTPFEGGHDDDLPDHWGTPEECAARGLAWLREDGPRLGLDVSRIDPQTVWVGSMSLCPLAQAGNGLYDTIVQRITGRSWLSDECVAWAEAHGFMMGDGGSGDTLTDAWRQLLAPATVE